MESGEFFWNSGIFLWTADSIIRELHEHAPDLAATFDAGHESFGTPAEKEFIEKNFPGVVGISIDFAVMEKSQNVYVECVASAGATSAHGARSTTIRPRTATAT